MEYKVIFYTFLVTFFFWTVGTSQASTTENFASFLAGVLLIEENKNLTQEQKAHEYRQLQQLTGICGFEAIQFIERFRNRPVEFKRFYGLIITELTGAEKEKTDPSGKKESYNKN